MPIYGREMLAETYQNGGSRYTSKINDIVYNILNIKIKNKLIQKSSGTVIK